MTATPDVGTAPPPAGWSVRQLGDISKITIGRTPSRSVRAFWGPGHPWAAISDLNAKVVSATREQVTPLAARDLTVIPKGTLMMSFKLTLGRLAFAGVDMYSNEAICSLFDPAVDPGYLYYALSRANFARVGARAVMGHTLNSEALARLEVLVPPAAEQVAIAHSLSDVDDLVAALGAQIDKKRAVRTAAIRDLLTRVARLPGFEGTWRTTTIGELFTLLSTANNPRYDLSDEGDVGYVHYGDVHGWTSVTLDCVTTALPRIARARVQGITRLQSGDLIVVDASEDYDGIGKMVEVSEPGRETVGGLHTLLLRPVAGAVARGFGAFVQFMPSVRRALLRTATGVSVYGITRGNLKSIEIILPSIEEQSAIARVLLDMTAEIDHLEAKRVKAISLKTAMAQTLLTGRTRLR